MTDSSDRPHSPRADSPQARALGAIFNKNFKKSSFITR